MTKSAFHGLAPLVLVLPTAFAFQHNTRLYAHEIEEATAHVMRYDGWFDVVGDVTPDHKECTATDLPSSTFLATEKRYTCDLYFQEFSQPASFSIRVSYNAREDADLIASLDAVFLGGKYERQGEIHDRVNHPQEVVHLGVILERFDTAIVEKTSCTLRALPYEHKTMTVDTFVCHP